MQTTVATDIGNKNIEDDPRPFRTPIQDGCLQVGSDDIMICENCGGQYYQRAVLCPNNIIHAERTVCPCVAETKAQRDTEFRVSQVRTRQVNMQYKVEQYFSGFDLMADYAYNKMIFASYKPKNQSQKEALTKLQAFTPGRESICLYGAAGRGKTHLALSVARVAKGNSQSVLAIKAIDLLTRIKRTYDRKDDTAEIEIMRLLKDIDLLVIDDIGTERTSDWVKSKFYEIVDYRHGRRTTIYTTNLTGQEMEKKEGMAVVSRIFGSEIKILLEGQDLRLI